MELICEGGAGALTIRGVAARAGVSHAAPAHHFRSLMELRTAVAAQAHRDFTAMMESAIAEAPDTPRDALLAACIGYLRFARANPGLFQVMFNPVGVNKEDETLHAASEASYGVLARVCKPLAHGSAGPRGTEILVWSLIHGFSSLALLGEFTTEDPAEMEAWFKEIFPQLAIA
jgi:AcrR family transcriptional regulator